MKKQIDLFDNLGEAFGKIDKGELPVLQAWLRYLRKLWDLPAGTGTATKTDVLMAFRPAMRRMIINDSTNELEKCKKAIILLPEDWRKIRRFPNQPENRWLSTPRKVFTRYAVSLLRESLHPEGIPSPHRVTPEMLGLAEDRQFAILADCAEEAGCTDQEALDHLRLDIPHVPELCWAVRRVLRK